MNLHVPPPSQPLAVAEALMASHFNQDGYPTLVYFNALWWQYTGICWKQITERAVRDALYDVLRDATYDEGDDQRPFSPNQRRVSDIIDPLKYAAGRFLDDESPLPAWIAGGPAWVDPTTNTPVKLGDPGDYIVLKNGVLNRHSRTLYPHHPGLFTRHHLGFHYDPAAACPCWGRFCNEIFAHDPAAREALQEWFGYVLSGRTDLQRALVLVGPPAAGKGTVAAVLKAITGAANTTAASLDRLGGRFDLASWDGKLLALFEDARDDGRTHVGAAGVSTMLSVVGEDSMVIERKNRDAYTVDKMSARIMIVANSEPTFNDNTGAIQRRILGIKLDKSFGGKSDPNIKANILKELPGIFNWALDGLARLEAQGTFTTPATQETIQAEMRSLGSPVREFLEDVYIITGDPEDRVLWDETYRLYEKWNQDNGRGGMSKQKLRNQINNAAVEVSVRRRDVGQWSGEKSRKRQWFTMGVMV